MTMISVDEEKKQRAVVKDGHLYVKYTDKWREVPLHDYIDIIVISSGANAVTVSGINKITERKDCIKIYTPNRSAGRKKVSIEQYLREVRKLSRLNEPRIVTIYDAFDVDKDIHVVAMEYIDGITLKEWLRHNDSWNYEQDYLDRLHILKEILEVVLYYQEKGIIHGDLHLKNILIDELNRVHLIDFGTSIFGKDNLSEERECFFVYDLVRQVMGDEFDEGYFTVKCPNNIFKKKCVRNDVRSKYPLLVTKTLMAYVKAMDLVLQLPQSLEPPDIVELCVELTGGIYIDFDYAINNIWEKATDKRIGINTVAHIIGSNIDEHIIPEDIGLHPDISATLQEDLLEIYYQLAMMTRAKWNIKRIKENTLSRYKGCFSGEEYDSIMDTILAAKEVTYLEFMCSDTTYSRKEDEDYRVVMYEALVDYFGNLAFAQELWARLNERRWKRELSKMNEKNAKRRIASY